MYDPIFPGFDPFIEDQRWAAFHNNLIIRIQDELARLLLPLYDVVAESYVELIRPDVSVFRGRGGTEPLEKSDVVVFPATYTSPLTLYDLHHPQRVEIYNETGQLVTIIEVLSPANKQGGGREAYLHKRNAILGSRVNLVELDLVRAGQRLEPQLPSEGYNVIVGRARPHQIHHGEFYVMGLGDVLPVIPIPLDGQYPDVPLELARLFREAYISSRYRLSLNYEQMPHKPFSPEDQAWIEAQLKAAFAEEESR